MTVDAIVIAKRSVFDSYSNSIDGAVQRYAQNGSADAERLRQSHDAHLRTLESVTNALAMEGMSYVVVDRTEISESSLPNKAAGVLAIAVGGDGTFIDASHHVYGVPLLGVNSDPERSVGFYCAADGSTVREVLASFDSFPRTYVSRLRLEVDGITVSERVLNDFLFAHPNPASMTRYELISDTERKMVRDSGLLVCTAAGSTAWMYQEGGQMMRLNTIEMQYRSRGVRDAVSGFTQSIKVRSLTRTGMLYIDGPHVRREMPIGSELEVTPRISLEIVGDLEKKRDQLFARGNYLKIG